MDSKIDLENVRVILIVTADSKIDLGNVRLVLRP